MTKAVRFDEYGGIDVLKVVDVERPAPGEGEVLVRVRAAGINRGEAMIREGRLHAIWPATFPSGQGSDFAGVVEAVGPGANGVAVGDEVFGFTDNRASHAEYVVAEAANVTPKPPEVPWEVAGALHVVGATAWAAVRAVAPRPGDVVAVAGSAGGVGTLSVQLARDAGATVIGLASESHHAWLRDHGVIPVSYGEGVGERILAAGGGRLDAFIDLFGGYIDLARELGVPPERINTIIPGDRAANPDVKSDGNAVGASAAVLAELAGLVAAGRLELPIARTYPLAEVREAYTDLERRHTLGKIVLVP
jgi:NADPH:quinone reductase-like Zn-dependent oxidoreductase